MLFSKQLLILKMVPKAVSEFLFRLFFSLISWFLQCKCHSPLLKQFLGPQAAFSISRRLPESWTSFLKRNTGRIVRLASDIIDYLFLIFSPKRHLKIVKPELTQKYWFDSKSLQKICTYETFPLNKFSGGKELLQKNCECNCCPKNIKLL